LKISTRCDDAKPLRLTGEHLVYTSRGLRQASEIVLGDLLFQDMDEAQPCEVIKIEKETNQKYFALNCEESIVIADGWKTSTFGLTHEIPAMWMKWASKVLGVRRASTFGDWAVSWMTYFQLL